MCPAVPPLDTKPIYLPMRTTCVWVCTYACPYTTHTASETTLTYKTAQMVAAYCSGCSNVVVNRGMNKMTVTFWDDDVSDLHVTRTAVVATFRSRDMATFVPEEMDVIMNPVFNALDAPLLSNKAWKPNKIVVHAHVVIECYVRNRHELRGTCVLVSLLNHTPSH